MIGREDREYYDTQRKRSSSIIAVISLIAIVLCLIVCGLVEFVRFIIKLG